MRRGGSGGRHVFWHGICSFFDDDKIKVKKSGNGVLQDLGQISEFCIQ
ncbi:hypothetical protein D083_1532 [Dickeya solani RNS 08.23.3.1.A]|nr:hypothetical protein D083_1532 [Dickeya solani RNS 08.23.3.1.A]